jgi:hypothetical protein
MYVETNSEQRTNAIEVRDYKVHSRWNHASIRPPRVHELAILPHPSLGLPSNLPLVASRHERFAR